MTTRKVTKKSGVPATIETLVSQCLTSINEVATTLPLDNVSLADVKAAVAVKWVPDAAMTIAANVIEQNPTLFGGFDAATIQAGVEYEQAVTPLANKIEQLLSQITQTITNRRGAAATQTLALSVSLKQLARLPANPPLKTEQGQLAALLVRTHKVQATSVTVAEKTAAVKAVKATKVATAKAAKAALANQAAAAAAVAAGISVPVAPTSTAPTPTPTPTASTATIAAATPTATH